MSNPLLGQLSLLETSGHLPPCEVLDSLNNSKIAFLHYVRSTEHASFLVLTPQIVPSGSFAFSVKTRLVVGSYLD